MSLTLQLFFALIVFILAVYGVSPFFLEFAEKGINKVDHRCHSPASKEAEDFHADLFVGDLHADPLFTSRDLLKKHATGHSDLPRLQEGNISLQVFGVPTQIPLFANIEQNRGRLDMGGILAFLQHWPVKTWYSTKQRALYQAGKLRDLERNAGGALTIIKTSGQLEELRRAHRNGVGSIGGVLMLEGAHVIRNIPKDVEELYHHGFRIIGITHLADNELGGSAQGVHKGGLTELGRKAVRRMEELGITIDLAHASPAMMEDVLEMTSRPVMVSHTGVKGCVDNNRNLTDEQVKAVASRGGLIGIGFWEEAVGSKGVEGIVDSIGYAADLGGVGHIALGSDFDGGVPVPFDAAAMVLLTEGLMKRGFSREDIRMIMGENAFNFLVRNLPPE